MRVVMNEICLESYQINPFVRYVQLLDVAKLPYSYFTRPYDCRLWYVYKGSGVLYVGKNTYPISHGMLAIWHPGIRYKLESDKDDSLFLLGVNFDFTQNSNNFSYPIPPDSESQFESKKILETVVINDIPAANNCIILSNTQPVEDMLLKILHEFDTKKIYYPVIISSILRNILFYAFRKQNLALAKQNYDSDKVDKILAFIQSNYKKNITNHSISEYFNYHPNYLNKLVKQSTGSSLYQYIINYRISKAIDLLSNTSLSIGTIAIDTGFKDIYHFSKTFKQKTGLPPSKLRFI